MDKRKCVNVYSEWLAISTQIKSRARSQLVYSCSHKRSCMFFFWLVSRLIRADDFELGVFSTPRKLLRHQESIFGRCPPYASRRSDQFAWGVSQALIETDSVARSENWFREAYANIKKCPHADNPDEVATSRSLSKWGTRVMRMG